MPVTAQQPFLLGRRVTGTGRWTRIIIHTTVLPIFTDVVPSATDVFLYATNVSVATVVGHAFPRRSSRVQRVVSCSTHVSPCATHVSVATVVGHGFPRRCFPYVRTATDVLPIYTNVVPCATYVAPYLRMCFRMQRVDPCATQHTESSHRGQRERQAGRPSRLKRRTKDASLASITMPYPRDIRSNHDLAGGIFRSLWLPLPAVACPLS
jgi:hypothetical protein